MIYDQTNIVLVSDHGMTNIYKDKGIDLAKMLLGFDYKTNGYDPIFTFFADEQQIEMMYEILKRNEQGYSVYRKNEITENLKIAKSEYIGKIMVMAHPGYYFINTSGTYSKGAHGFDNKIIDMHGVFVASGPAFKQGIQTGTVQNIDIYPLLCKALDITPNREIDGQLDRVEHLLKK